MKRFYYIDENEEEILDLIALFEHAFDYEVDYDNIVIALGVSLSRLFFVYDKIFRAEQFVLQNRSIASLLFLLKTKIKPDKSVEEIHSNDMVIFKMYKKHAENENLGSHHMAFDENDYMINLKD